MVIVEFFDDNALENICGALVCRPERVILVGWDEEKICRSAQVYNNVLRANGISTLIEPLIVPAGDLDSIVRGLSEIFECYGEGCTFDLTGGNELYLVAVGIIMEKYGDRVQCHRFDLARNLLQDCDSEGAEYNSVNLKLSVKDMIAINGGAMVEDALISCYTYPWRFSPEFVSDVAIMWNICRANPKLWNGQISTLASICEILPMPSPLEVSFNEKEAQQLLSKRRIKYNSPLVLLDDLQQRGLILGLSVGNTVSFVFKDEQVKKCLTLAGQVLELYVASCLLDVRSADGTPVYHDMRVGVVIDWNNENDTEPPTINEIDIIAMKGAIPVFISCKNGYFDANELYKLDTVSDRFGNGFAKRVLVTSGIGTMGLRAEQLVARMEDMGIKCLDALAYEQKDEFIRALASIWDENKES